MADAKPSNADYLRRTVRRALIGLTLVVLIVAGAAIWHVRPIHHRFHTDADTIREPAETASLRQILWQPPV